jgi:hypothetical protein
MTARNEAERVSEINALVTAYQGETIAATDTGARSGVGTLVATLNDEKRRLSGLSYYGKPA